MADLTDDHVQRAQDLERLEPADHAWHMIVPRKEVKEPRPRYDGNVSGQEKSVHRRRPVIEQGAHHGRDQLLRRQQEEVSASLPLRREHSRRLGRCGRLKADGEEDDLLCGILRRNGQRVQRRVDDAHVGACRLRLSETGVRSRHLQHIAERRDDDILHPRIGNRRIDVAVRRHADGTAGT